tara:strand:- start:126 stop:305 length:180 start_codon:yes stop_codon:yes gene_type:complete
MPIEAPAINITAVKIRRFGSPHHKMALNITLTHGDFIGGRRKIRPEHSAGIEQIRKPTL